MCGRSGKEGGSNGRGTVHVAMLHVEDEEEASEVDADVEVEGEVDGWWATQSLLVIE